MAISFLTNISEEEFKKFLKQSLLEILEEKSIHIKSETSEIFDVKQAAAFLKCKVATLYEKTSQKIIPHIKKGNKLYFNKQELQEWLQKGRIKTKEEIQQQATSYLSKKQKDK